MVVIPGLGDSREPLWCICLPYASLGGTLLVYMPPYCLFVGVSRTRRRPETPPSYPLHCWRTPQSPVSCTFINFMTERGVSRGPNGSPRGLPTRFTVGQLLAMLGGEVYPTLVCLPGMPPSRIPLICASCTAPRVCTAEYCVRYTHGAPR